jgi:hypothetical protein
VINYIFDSFAIRFAEVPVAQSVIPLAVVGHFGCKNFPKNKLPHTGQCRIDRLFWYLHVFHNKLV